MSEQYRITTLDNPFNPFTQFEDWYNWDELHGHHTCGLIDRVAETSESFTQDLNDSIKEAAIDSLMDLFPGQYRKISETEAYADVKTV